MKIKMIINKQIIEKEFDSGITCEMMLETLTISIPYKILLCKINNNYKSLNSIINDDCTIEFLDMRNNEAWLVYQNSLVFLYKKAINDILGDVQMDVSNSLNKGLYTTIKAPINKDVVAQIETRMKELVNENLPIIKEQVSGEDILRLAHKIKASEKTRLIYSMSDLKDVEIYSLGDTKELFYNLMVPSTSYLEHFELIKYRNGILLRYPHISSPNEIPVYEDQKLLYDAFSEATRWDKLMGVNYVTDLNEKIKNNQYEDLIMLQEALHEKKISDIADEIKKQNKRIILICGPSSSGKTSFAKRLCIQLRVIGVNPLYLGTDDYFVEREETAIDENGEKDFESIRSVDVDLFNKQMNELLSGQKVDLPTFDFYEGKKIFGKRIVTIDKTQPIVVEGIHALNEVLTSEIDDNEKFKIYISPLTQLNIDNHNRIPTTDARMLRRLVRDNQFRGRSAHVTIADWPKVRKGEDHNIFPYIGQADVFFNTNYIYELAVLKKYAEPLLNDINEDEPEYAEAQRMLSFLKFFETMEDDSMIANNSILREFIGGSILVK